MSLTTELFSSTSYNSAWTSSSDVWVLLNPDINHWTEAIDWQFGMLLRRALVRSENKSAENKSSDVLLLAAPLGMPTPRLLVLRNVRQNEAEWLTELAPILTKLKAKSATVFAPREWRPPTLKMITDASQGEWGLRWVEAAG
jgi:hypothetical protein